MTTEYTFTVVDESNNGIQGAVVQWKDLDSNDTGSGTTDADGEVDFSLKTGDEFDVWVSSPDKCTGRKKNFVAGSGMVSTTFTYRKPVIKLRVTRGDCWWYDTSSTPVSGATLEFELNNSTSNTFSKTSDANGWIEISESDMEYTDKITKITPTSRPSLSTPYEWCGDIEDTFDHNVDLPLELSCGTDDSFRAGWACYEEGAEPNPFDCCGDPPA